MECWEQGYEPNPDYLKEKVKRRTEPFFKEITETPNQTFVLISLSWIVFSEVPVGSYSLKSHEIGMLTYVYSNISGARAMIFRTQLQEVFRNRQPAFLLHKWPFCTTKHFVEKCLSTPGNMRWRRCDLILVRNLLRMFGRVGILIFFSKWVFTRSK